MLDDTILTPQALEEATGFLQHRFPYIATAGVAIQTGSGHGCEAILDETWGRCALTEIPGMPDRASAADHRLEVLWGLSAGIRVVLLSGRFHRYEGFGLPICTLPIWALANCGVRTFFFTNAAGGIRDDLTPGRLMLILDHINNLGVSPLRGNQHLLRTPFVDCTEVYSATLSDGLRAAAAAEGVPLADGVYLANNGPQFETPAEVRMAARWGADAVGMSTVAEAITARAFGARVVGISVISNRAAGLTDGPVSHDAVVRVCRDAGESLTRVVRRWLQEYGQALD